MNILGNPVATPVETMRGKKERTGILIVAKWLTKDGFSFFHVTHKQYTLDKPNFSLTWN